MKDVTRRTLPTERPPRFREAMVSGLAPLRVTIAGTETHAAHLAAYSPVVGQRVLVLFDMGGAVVMGRIVSD